VRLAKKVAEGQPLELLEIQLHENPARCRGSSAEQPMVTRPLFLGGASWSKPVEDQALIEPVCQASIVRYPRQRGGPLFSNPASKKREKMTIRLSQDEGKTWPVARTIHEGPAAYSCLAVLKGREHRLPLRARRQARV